VSQGSNAPARTRALVIVESPTKQRQISGFLGDDYVVRSSMGHIRDLPQSASQVPAKEKDKAWARLGVDVDDGFEPLYVVSPEKKQLVRDLAQQLKGVDVNEHELARVEAIVLSMTPKERRMPHIINGSRRVRIARGSGTTVQQVNQLLGQFKQMQKMMKQIGKGKMPQFPGLTR